MSMDYYLKYKGGAMPAPVNVGGGVQNLGMGAQAAAGATAALPWVSAGLSAAGLLSSLYGGYKQQQSEKRNYRAQMAEFQRQKAMEEEDRRRQMEADSLSQRGEVSKFNRSIEDDRLARYAPYYASIGR